MARRPERLRFRHLTPAEKRIVCNGCGPKGGWVPVPEFVFTEACNHHDFNYWIGCTKAQRKKADKQFLKEMLLEAGNSYWYKTLAYIYYKAVRVAGGKCFYHGDKQRTKMDLKWYITELALKQTIGGEKK